MSISAPRARRPLVSTAASLDDGDNYALDTYPAAQQAQAQHEKASSTYSATRSRPLGSKDNDSLLSASSWLQPDELIAKGKIPQGSSVSRLQQPKGSKGPVDFLGGGLSLSSGECKILAAVFVLASAVRLYRLDRPSSVV